MKDEKRVSGESDMGKTGYLILENRMIFKGKSFGAIGDVIGEVVFTTGMTGYLETLTDKSYYGQIVVQTFPLIGNYGVIPADLESLKPQVKGYIVKEWCKSPSNFRCEGDIDTFLKKHGIIGLYDVDTREITKIIRETGVMNGRITDSIESIDIERIKKYKICDAVKNVSTDAVECLKPDNGISKYKVVLWDLGTKENIKRELLKRDCEIFCVPFDITAEEIAKISPDGIVLSNGPGDPAQNLGIVNELKSLVKYRIPIFGICLGHQLLALANGAKTQKMKYGHRGFNQPVRDLSTGRVYITSQNHGYAVVSESLDKSKTKLTFTNVNDGTCEGIEYIGTPAFSVQFHPEAAAGPLDTSFLFDRFIKLMGEENKCL